MTRTTAKPSARKCRQYKSGVIAYKPLLLLPRGRTRVLGQDGAYKHQGLTFRSRVEAVQFAAAHIDDLRADVVRRATGRPKSRCSDARIRSLQGEFEVWGGSGDVFDA